MVWLVNSLYYYNSLIHPEPTRKSVGGFKDKTVSLFKINTPYQTVYGRIKKLTKSKPENKIINPFILKKKENKDRIIRDVRAFYETEKEKIERKKMEKKINLWLIKDGIIRDIRTLQEQEEEQEYYKPKRVSNFWKNNYIEYESNNDKSRNLAVNKWFNKIELYLMNIIFDLQNSDTWKLQLTIAMNFVSSEDVEEEQVMHNLYIIMMQMKLLMNFLSHFIQDIKEI